MREMISLELVGKTVLVVDDDPQVLMLFERLLVPFGCKVLTALCSLEAHRLHDEHHSNIALVLVDIMMPGINGIDFIRALRLYNAHVPIVVVSGMAIKARQTANIEEQGISAWLNKPFAGTDFEQMLSDLFSTNETAPLLSN